MSNAISIRGISKSYKGIPVLRDISLDVPEGKLFGLIGPDGSGKSTLYRLLTTLEKPDAGNARVAGYDIGTQFKEIRSSVGYMPQQFSLYPDLSVMENLHFFASLFGVKVSDNYSLIAPFFDQLAKFPDRRAGALSGGMKQKLALGCALIHRPRILMLDEPTTGVDAISRSEFWDMLAYLRDTGITILVSTSYMDEAQKCDRIALIYNGCLYGVDTPAALASRIDVSLYAVSATEMYRLLKEMRRLDGVECCYTFGSTLHAVVKPHFDAGQARRQLEAAGLKCVHLEQTQGDIEDLFIRLASDEERKSNIC